MSLRVNLNLETKSFREAIKLEIELQGVTAIFGPSGCGKTSLLRAISGLDKHLNSSVYFADECWQSGAYFLPTYKRGLSYVFQEASLFSHMTVEQNLDFALDRATPRSKNEFLGKQRICQLLNITQLLSRESHALSGGERQRVAIARSLCAQPKLLLMDEPLSALDAGHKAEIIPLLERVCNQSGVPILYVSHAIEEVARFADTMVVMNQGQVIGQGGTAEVLSELGLPLAQQADALSILDGTVVEQDLTFSLTRVNTAAGHLYISHAQGLVPGASVRIKVGARDVSIALEQPSNTSILNSLVATITEMQTVGDGQVMVKLNASGNPMLAKITSKSQAKLGLYNGQSVVLQVKSCALL